ncbi:unnamed protein product [Toxocara canis]|uniref:Uncharacterized protein n=1 Tax=Toxocara canis TaxID=6265 RepID=A0A183U1V2_TOXCA|nr:unnamed protein product [Toxocara canis]
MEQKCFTKHSVPQMTSARERGAGNTVTGFAYTARLNEQLYTYAVPYFGSIIIDDVPVLLTLSFLHYY